jgi:hypothetical protein
MGTSTLAVPSRDHASSFPSQRCLIVHSYELAICKSIHPYWLTVELLGRSVYARVSRTYRVEALSNARLFLLCLVCSRYVSCRLRRCSELTD